MTRASDWAIGGIDGESEGDIESLADGSRDISTADGGTVRKGDRVWNYYDLAWVTIAEDPDSEGWFSTTTDDGQRGPTLNGERITVKEIRPR